MLCIQVDKSNFTLSAFHDVVNALKEGDSVVIFPEGEVNQNDTRAPLAFKSGAVLMAHKSGAPLVPMYIVRREHWYQRQYVVVGESIDVRTMLGPVPTMEAMTRASDFLHDQEEKLRVYYENWIQNKRNK